MKKTSNKKIKHFKRFLKEIGIYSLYIKERKKRDGYYTSEEFWENVTISHSYGDAIVMAFAWHKTNNPHLWKLIDGLTRFHDIKILLDDYTCQLLKGEINTYLLSLKL